MARMAVKRKRSRDDGPERGLAAYHIDVCMLFAALRTAVYSGNEALPREKCGVAAHFRENRRGNRSRWP
jgi:hypothetical protein